MILLHERMRKCERLDEFLFGQFVSGAFDHDHIVLRADIDEVEIAVFAFRCVGLTITGR